LPELKDRLQVALGPGYRVERELGGGGMSRVFLAEEVRLGRRVVVKVLPPEMSLGVSAERFEREIFTALPTAYRRLGELYEQKGNREKALEYYGKLAELWKDADPDLQPTVSDLKQRMVHLAGEGGPR